MTKPLVGGLGHTILGVVWTEAAIGTILVALRAYAASKKHGKWRGDFIWIVVALITALLGSVIVTVAVARGLGNHTRNLSYTQLFEAVKWVWMSIWFGLPPSVFAKFSIIALLLDVQSPSEKKRAYILWGIGFLVASTTFIQIFLSLFQCTPVSRLWLLASEGTCPRNFMSGRFSYFQGSVQAAADFALALWPVTIVWNLQTSQRVKIAFCLLMAIGILPSIAVILRIVSLPSITSSKDPTYDFGKFMLWGVSEIWLVIILGSIPPLRPLFLRIFYGIHPNSSGKGTSAPTREYGTGAQSQSNLRSGLRSQLTKNATEVNLHNLDNISEDGSDSGLTPGPNGIMVVNSFTVDEEGRSSYVGAKRESTDVEAVKNLMKD
ncbi:Hypothetical protein D9617_1g080130 [Elsinoe fawcettii]|nr:Hypothetical protein D9617_1g080130 [Elsinoe fawcettii]